MDISTKNDRYWKRHMDAATILRDFAFSQYESTCYLALLSSHPANGSKLSRLSGISRSRIYDVLRGLIKKGMVFEIDQGQYVPLPFEEFKKKVRSQFESNLNLLEEKLDALTAESTHEYLLPLKGIEDVMRKAEDVIDSAKREVYLRLFPETWRRLKKAISNAAARGVGIRFIAMGDIPVSYDIQVNHPHSDDIGKRIGGQSIDIVADKVEAISGIFETGNSNHSPVIWSRNRWFVIANRDSLRHDFYHTFLDKVVDQKQPLSAREKAIYEFIKSDD